MGAAGLAGTTGAVAFWGMSGGGASLLPPGSNADEVLVVASALGAQ